MIPGLLKGQSVQFVSILQLDEDNIDSMFCIIFGIFATTCMLVMFMSLLFRTILIETKGDNAGGNQEYICEFIRKTTNISILEL